MKNNQNLDSNYVREYYDDFLKNTRSEYADFRWFNSEYNRYEYKQTKRAILKILKCKTSRNVIEVGCGDGVWTEIFAVLAGQVTALDISSQMLERAKRRLADFANINFIQGDFLNNNLQDERYDLLCAIRCFEYFPDKKKSVQEMHRILKPGGAVILITKNSSYRWRIMRGGETKLLHRGQVPPHLLKKIFEDEGFTVQGLWPAILGKKMGLAPARFFFDIVHRVSLSRWGWLVPGVVKKYFSESFLIYAIKK